MLKNDRDAVLDGLIQDANRIKEEYESRSGSSLDPVSGMNAIPHSNNFS